MWNRDPPPGFQGLDPEKPIAIYQRNLPHWRQDGASYFVTFHLSDSLPQNKLRELRKLKAEWERRHPPPRSHDAMSALARLMFERVDGWLDQGMGRCQLRKPELAIHIIEAMHHFDGARYELGCYAIMPNHVHAVVRPLLPDSHPLEGLVGGWKKYSALHINRQLGQAGHLWHEETYDRIIRDEEHLFRVIQYIGSNPQSAGLDPSTCPVWIRPQWEQLGWRFECTTAL